MGRRGYRISEFINQNKVVGIGSIFEAIRGSKEVKMSENINNLMGFRKGWAFMAL